ncbi:gliding motility-associated C-terminal domain-containing protein, partial [Crocinitomix catalasitica]|nr:gliding motility-associated C-terminal domain-containing protein [Crocinitomix catalasitica]
FIGNDCAFFGGGYHSLFGSTVMENVLFSGNQSGDGGGAYFRGSTTLAGCTFSGNRASISGGAMLVYVSTIVNIVNSIYWNNQDVTGVGTLGAFYSVEAGSSIILSVESSIIQGSGGSGGSWAVSFGVDAGSNLDTDPLFNSPVSPASAPTVAGNYRLTFPSPAKNSAINAYAVDPNDLDDNARIAYGIIDMGCYEFCETLSTITASACSSFTSPSGMYIWTADGVYSDTLSNSLGCDSVITINLSINESFSTISPVVCESYVPPSGSPTITSSGTYVDIIPNSVGCDSTITINLIVLEATSATHTITVCNSMVSPSGTYLWTTTGVYMDTILNSAGCDSALTFNLTVNMNSASAVTLSSCEFYNSPAGNVYTSSGIYNDTISNSAGCDSIIVTNLTILNNTSSTIDEEVCGSYSPPSGGPDLTTSGSYIDVIPNSAGCDSTITINLTVNPLSYSEIFPEVCDQYISPSGLFTCTASGIYSDTLTNSIGCDSIITINLIINNVDPTVTVFETSLSSNEINGEYQWVDCDNNMNFLTAETFKNFQPVTDGNYAVIVSTAACVDTSDCFRISVPLNIPTVFSPNNDGVNDTFQMGVEMENFNVVFFNRWGDEIRYIENYDDETNAWDGTDDFGLLQLGVYYYIIENTEFNGWVQVLF